VRPLPRRFYRLDSRELAPLLLNKVLVLGPCRARIVEVEAYGGTDDAGSHAFRGRTARNAAMFADAGHLYVYFTYGMHWCANVVAGPAGDPGAVLLRAAAPVAGLDAMRARRPTARLDRDLCRGPARLSAAFGIDGRLDGADLVDRRGPWLADDGTPPPSEPGVSRRIGLTRGADHPWRWFVPGDPHRSRPG
jgi:DNA-3-methyladenine glycosylase